MIKKLVDTDEFMLLEISDIEMYGRPIKDMSAVESPVLAVLILEYIKVHDFEIDECINENPGMYESMVFPLNGRVYAAIFLATVCEQAVLRVRAFIMENYNENPFEMAYAYDFDSLCNLEDFIRSRVITKTDKSALYKFKNKYCYVTCDAIIGLCEYFINARQMSLCVLDEHGEAIISSDAYDKIFSYVFCSEAEIQ